MRSTDRWRLRLIVMMLAVGACASWGWSQSSQPAPSQADRTAVTMNWSAIFQSGDRVLLVGDQVTQQMFYSRAVATALLGLMPDRSLRFYNGGHDGATTTLAVQWIDELMELTQPQVVMVCFGLSDALEPATRDVTQGFGQGLDQLLDRIQGYRQVRQVIVISPMAVQPGINLRLDALEINQTLTQLSATAQQQARQHGVGWIDLMPVSREIMQAASQTDGEPLSFINGQPTEIGHGLMAGMILSGLGVTCDQMAQVGWAPLPPKGMARIRSALSVTQPVPTFEQAQRCRDLYLMLLEHDQLFFRAWRIAGKMPSAGSRESALSLGDQAWSRIERHLRQAWMVPLPERGQ